MAVQMESDFPALLASGDASLLEAESRRYGASAFMVLPLASGKIAVLGSMRALWAICDTWEEVKEAALSIPLNQWRRSTESEAIDGPSPRATPSLETTKSAGDLGL